MKLFKILTAALAVTAAVTLCSSARASVGATTNFLRFNFSMVVKTNVQHVAANSFSYTFGQRTLVNRDLLKLFKQWAAMDVLSTNALPGTDTNFPNGAQLVLSMDWGNHVLVVKQNTNVLYVVPNSGSHFFTVDFSVTNGVFSASGSRVTAAYSQTAYDLGYFELYDGNFYLTNTDLYAFGPSVNTYSQNATATTWQATSRFQSFNAGVYFQNPTNTAVSITASIIANGHSIK